MKQGSSKGSILFVALLGLSFSIANADVRTDRLVEAIQSTELDPTRAVRLRKFAVDMGPATLVVDHGWLVPSKPIDGKVYEIAFVGKAEFEFEPPDEIEAQQLEIFFDDRRILTPIDTAVWALGNTEIIDTLFDGKSFPAPPEIFDRANEAFEAWTDSAEREVLGLNGALLKVALGETTYQNYVLFQGRGEFLDHPLVYIVDPTEAEPIQIGQFVPLELDDVEAHQFDKYIKRQRRRGRFTGLDRKTLGDWQTWCSTSEGAAGFSSYGAVPLRYAIDLTIVPDELRFEVVANLGLVTRVSDLRVATLQLSRRFDVTSVRDAATRSDLDFYRHRNELHIVFPEPLVPGVEREIAVTYAGEGLERWDRGDFVLANTLGWYPSATNPERATFDVTLRWPKSHQLVAAGELIDAGETAKQRWERRQLSRPSLGFSFEIGRFEITRQTVGHVEITYAFGKARGTYYKGSKQQAMQIIESALLFYEATFGPYPDDHLTVVTVPRDFSQGLPGFITLSQFLLWVPKDYHPWGSLVLHRQGERVETLAHEVAHQWWGNKVGWIGYRDQWLSEALADYSAILYLSDASPSQAKYFSMSSRSWHSRLDATTKDGRTYESLGPVVLGTRLLRNFGPRPYSSVVYDKGAVVFRMLARRLQYGPFNEMLRVLADRVNHRQISTEVFLKSIERMSGQDLSDFADQFIYGTGVPEIYYDYEFTQDGETWVIEGQAKQVSSVRFAYRLDLDDTGRWSLWRSPQPHVDVATHDLIVPFQIALAREKDGERTGRGLGGDLSISGETSEFRIEIDEEPVDFWLDRRREVLASFFREHDSPKETKRFRAVGLPASEAIATLEAALDSPAFGPEIMEEVEEEDRKKRTKTADYRILLDLAEVHLVSGDVGRARAALERADGLLKKSERNRLWRGSSVWFRMSFGISSHRPARRPYYVLEAWADLLDRDFKTTYANLSKKLRLDFPRLETDVGLDAIRRKRFSDGVRGTGDAYALLAVSALETGHREVAEAAMEEAELRSVDVSALRERIEAPSPNP